MSDEEIVLGDAPDDSPWRAGSGARFERPAPRLFNKFAADSDSVAPSASLEPPDLDRARSIGRGGRTWLASAVVAVVLIAASVVVARSLSLSPSIAVQHADGPDFHTEVRTSLGRDVALASSDTPLLAIGSDCPERRLPGTVDQRWRINLEATAINAPVHVSRESVFAIVHDVVDESVDGPTRLVALAIEDGRERWHLGLRATGVRIAGIIDGVVVVDNPPESSTGDRQLLGVDEVSGELLWSHVVGAGDGLVVDDVADRIVIVAEPLPETDTGVGEVRMLDPRTAAIRLTLPGALLEIGADGRIVTIADDEVYAADGFSEAQDGLRRVAIFPPSRTLIAVVGDAVITHGGESPFLYAFSTAADDSSSATRRVLLTGSGRLDPPGTVIDLAPLGDSALVISGDGAIHGAHVGPNDIEIRWRVDGILLEDAASDRGRSLLVASQGGAVRRVVDASTGRVIVDLPVRPGSAAVVDLPANGVLLRDHDDRGTVHIALDLDGREMWSLPGDGRLAVGSDMVVDVEPDPVAARVAITTYGGDPAGVPGCTKILESWGTT